MANIKVMLTTEGTYPHHAGGVSTWCDTLTNKLKNVDYTVYSIIMNPYVTQQFPLPKNAQLIKVPLWGTEEPFEQLKIPFSKIYRMKNNTVDKVVEEEFLPLFRQLIEQIVSKDKNPIQFGHLLLELYQYFRKYDYNDSFKSQQVWDTYTSIILDKAADKKNLLAQPSVFSMIQSLGWIYRFLTILVTPVPKVDVTHSAAAAFCGIPCVLAKLLYNTPYLLTEHGVYIREQYLSLSKRGYDQFLNTFFIRLVDTIVKMNYAFSDQVSPVCSYNTRWETKYGVLPNKIKVMYNGVDKEYFKPKKTIKKRDSLKVVTVARVDPVKDLITLIKAAKSVKKQVKNVTFHVYGSVTVPEYYEECLEAVKEAGLKDHFIFEGNTDDVPTAYASGDVIALSSITEAFPYSVVEAMMMGKPVVATDVGGISEAIGDEGFLVTPRQHEQLAESIVKLLQDQALRESIGQRARERAVRMFDLEDMLSNHYESYTALRDGAQDVVARTRKIQQQKLLAEKGYALYNIGSYEQSITQFRAAVREAPESLAVPVLLSRISDAYEQLGQQDMAENERSKANLVANMPVRASSA